MSMELLDSSNKRHCRFDPLFIHWSDDFLDDSFFKNIKKKRFDTIYLLSN